MLKATVQDGAIVKLGDYVSFKSDYEQCGQIVKIANGDVGVVLTLESVSANGFSGDYIKGQMLTRERAKDCWVE
jgi:hypothetical protein